MSKWGGEHYGYTVNGIPLLEEQREYYEVGEVALWPPGNAFCIFWGPTPASEDERPKMATPGIPLGRIIDGDIEQFKGFDDCIVAEIIKHYG